MMNEKLRMNSEKFASQNGITLIALIITIIILLILAGVTINVLIVDNGFFNIASEAGENYKIAGIKETVEAEILAMSTEKITKGEILTVEQALIGINEKGTFEEISIEESIGIQNGYVVTLGYDEKGNVIIVEIQKDVGVRLTIKQEPKGYTNGAVEITIGLSGKKEKITNIEVPNGMTKIEEGKYNIEINGNYNIKVTLENGEKLEKEIVINVIDKVSPKEFTPKVKGNNGKLEIKENGEDSKQTEESVKSGIDYYEYYVIDSNNEETKYKTNEITGLPAGIYKVYLIAYDKAGNYTKSEEVKTKLITEWIEIYNEEQLRNIANDLSKDYKLMQDIELTEDWTPIGNVNTNQFTGTLEGNGYKISGLNIENSTSDYQGLFADIGKEGRVSNLKVEGTITGKNSIGLLAVVNRGTIENVKVKGIVNGNECIGGLVGFNIEGTIEGCYGEVDVNGDNFLGGLAGDNLKGGTIKRSASSGRVTGRMNIGGLVAENSATIKNSYSTGEVSGTGSCVGGLAGRNAGTITNAYSLSTVNASGANIGGLIGIGLTGGITQNSYWSPEIAGVETSAGGTKLTKEEMKTQSSYEGWDFTSGTVWVMKEYPELIF